MADNLNMTNDIKMCNSGLLFVAFQQNFSILGRLSAVVHNCKKSSQKKNPTLNQLIL